MKRILGLRDQWSYLEHDFNNLLYITLHKFALHTLNFELKTFNCIQVYFSVHLTLQIRHIRSFTSPYLYLYVFVSRMVCLMMRDECRLFRSAFSVLYLFAMFCWYDISKGLKHQSKAKQLSYELDAAPELAFTILATFHF